MIEFDVLCYNDFCSAFSGKFWKLKDEGLYSCVVCNHPLFYSSSKFLSGCGWPSFTETIDKASVTYTKDTSYGQSSRVFEKLFNPLMTIRSSFLYISVHVHVKVLSNNKGLTLACDGNQGQIAWVLCGH